MNILMLGRIKRPLPSLSNPLLNRTQRLLFTPTKTDETNTSQRIPVLPHPTRPRKKPSPKQYPHIKFPPYAQSGLVPPATSPFPVLHTDPHSLQSIRNAAKLARRVLERACRLATPGVTTEEIDDKVHEAILGEGAYPSPLNYSGFPKSLCSSVNEVICHGIPDSRPLMEGDVVSFDVSCYLDGFHGDNCATVIVGSDGDESTRALVKCAKECLDESVSVCRPGGCLSDIGNTIQKVVNEHGFDTVQRYRGHGIGRDLHMAPFVKHYANDDRMELQPGMVFTIEPMITEGRADCNEWDDHWTVVTIDGGRAAQFEHMVLITETGVEVLTAGDNE
eukprot:CAMPEP_0172501484 /NCGR_PEP_ID=MMETSP1066-20121228/150291_1 /TAXON_ID=671091 /ORGANISM="Coscinodiscus wailesii, Strain CCMP2513" /LENGTH=333 /DNA_ID=CAMNT_0013276285 /DNA_START=62 /DNA_END=1063 /DNA_ORIENTATION=-